MSALIANIELLVLCIIMVCLLFIFNIRYWKPRILNPLSLIYLLVISGCINEIIAFSVDGNPSMIWLNYLSNILYLGGIGIIGVCMISYCNEQFPKPIWKTNFQHILIIFPACIELILLALSPLIGTIFTITPDGYYSRSGTFYFQLLPYGYLISTTVLGIYWYIKSETTKEKNENLVISLFAIPPFAFGAVQLLTSANQLDTMMFAIVLSLLANFAVSLRNRITRDPLTRLPNREVLDDAIKESIRNYRRGNTKHVFVIMGDMDGFKSINDSFGHLEGDRALVAAADNLYAICDQYKVTAARFGGDEFAIIGETNSKDLPSLLIEEIEKRLEDISPSEKYVLRMSMGYSFYQTEMTIQDLLRAADHELYRVKHERKQMQRMM